MSFLTRGTLRTVQSSSRAARFYSAGTSEFAAQQAAIEHHAVGTTNLWRKISFYVCFPSVAVCIAWVYNVESAHNEHQAHLMAENDGHLPPVPDYEFMNRRVKPFPWGMNSLFFNPHTNKDMSQSE